MRRQSDILLAAMPSRFTRLEGRMDVFERSLDANTAETRQIRGDTSTIVAFVKDFEAVWRICKRVRGFVFRTAKFSAAVAVAFTSIAAAVHAAGAFDVWGWAKGLFR